MQLARLGLMPEKLLNYTTRLPHTNGNIQLNVYLKDTTRNLQTFLFTLSF